MIKALILPFFLSFLRLPDHDGIDDAPFFRRTFFLFLSSPLFRWLLLLLLLQVKSRGTEFCMKRWGLLFFESRTSVCDSQQGSTHLVIISLLRWNLQPTDSCIFENAVKISCFLKFQVSHFPTVTWRTWGKPFIVFSLSIVLWDWFAQVLFSCLGLYIPTNMFGFGITGIGWFFWFSLLGKWR